MAKGYLFFYSNMIRFSVTISGTGKTMMIKDTKYTGVQTNILHVLIALDAGAEPAW